MTNLAEFEKRIKTKTFYYRNNTLTKVYENKQDAMAESRKELIKNNIRIETWTFQELVKCMGQGNAERYWNR